MLNTLGGGTKPADLHGSHRQPLQVIPSPPGNITHKWEITIV